MEVLVEGVRPSRPSPMADPPEAEKCCKSKYYVAIQNQLESSLPGLVSPNLKSEVLLVVDYFVTQSSVNEISGLSGQVHL